MAELGLHWWSLMPPGDVYADYRLDCQLSGCAKNMASLTEPKTGATEIRTSNMSSAECVIVGAGPAGGALASFLASNGESSVNPTV